MLAVIAPPPPSVVGELTIMTVDGRTVRMWRPAGLDRSRPAPVVWFLDGQNVFDAATSFIGAEWRADEAMTELGEAGLARKAVLVGIDNGGEKRGDEYLPTRVKFQGAEMGGGADAYLATLVTRLMPGVRGATLTLGTRLSTRSADNAIVGSSFGGVFALHAALSRPDVFGMAGVLSPSIWWDDRIMLRRVRALERTPRPRFWIDAGDGEGKDTVENARLVHEALLRKGARSVFYVGIGDRHDERAWSRRLPSVLTWLLRR